MREDSAHAPTHPPAPHPLALPLKGAWQFVHGPLAHWAQERPDHIALQCEAQQLSYAQLHAAVVTRSAALVAAHAPAMVMMNAGPNPLDALVEFLAIVHSGRCAAVADPDWPPPVRAAMAQVPPHAPHDAPPAQPTDAFYTGFTSGSTGLPKGFMRHHASWTESFRVALADLGAVAAGRMLAPGRLSHSLFLFGALQGLWCGSGAIVQTQFSAARCLELLARDAAPCMVAVPSQLMVLLQWAERRQTAPVMGLKLLLISGARWIRAHTPALRRLFPCARIVEFYGASEASFITWMDADETVPDAVVGRPFSNVKLDIRPCDGAAQPAAVNGLIYVQSPMLFMDYVGAHVDHTAALRDSDGGGDGEGDRGGDWLSVRDMGHVDAQGWLHLAGRQSRMIVTQGKNLFPEEVEHLLQSHPAIAQASLQARADPLRGMEVHAVLQWHDAASIPLPSAPQLQQWLRERTEGYKVPRRWWIATPWPQTASDKTDHAALRTLLHQPPDHSPLTPWR